MPRQAVAAALLVLALAGCTQKPDTTGAVAGAPAASAPGDLSLYIAGRSFTFDSGGTVTETFLAGGAGEWRRPSGRSGPFQWTLAADGTLCRTYAPSPATQSQKAWAGGTWCGTIARVPEGLQYSDAKSQGTGILKEVAPGAI